MSKDDIADVCPHCGKERREGDAYCWHCRQLLPSGALPVPERSVTTSCPHCANRLPDDAAFCPKCGIKVSTGVCDGHTEQNAQSVKRQSRRGGALLAIAILAVLIGGAWFLYDYQSSAQLREANDVLNTGKRYVDLLSIYQARGYLELGEQRELSAVLKHARTMRDKQLYGSSLYTSYHGFSADFTLSYDPNADRQITEVAYPHTADMVFLQQISNTIQTYDLLWATWKLCHGGAMPLPDSFNDDVGQNIAMMRKIQQNPQADEALRSQVEDLLRKIPAGAR